MGRVQLVVITYCVNMQKHRGPPLSLSFVFQSLCTFISAASKFAQLQCLWKSKDAGQVSALTWGMATYTCVGGCHVLYTEDSPPLFSRPTAHNEENNMK